MMGSKHKGCNFSGIAIFVLVVSLALAGCGDTINNTAGHAAPGIPTNVQAISADGQATITWSPASNAVSYNIYWKLSSGVTTTDNAILNASSPYVHPSLTNGQTHYYVVTGVNIDGEGDASSEVSATPAASTSVPSAPAGVQATAADKQAAIMWSPVSGATFYNVYWSTTAGGTKESNKIYNAPSPYLHMGLTNNTTYYYRVSAVNSVGESSLSSEVSATPAASTAVPSAPSNVQATAGDKQTIISWSPVAGATFYNIYWSTAAGVTTSSSKVYNAPSPYVHAGLTNNTTYYYRVSAVNSAGESSLSSEASVAPVSASTAPAVPVNVQLTPGDGKLTLTWDPVANATSYNIYWSFNSGVTTASNKITSAEFPYAHTGLTNNNTYYYRVSAVNSLGESSLSAEVSAAPRVPFSMELSKLISSPTETSAYFGRSVSISGDYMIIGASGKDEGENANAGAAYIFHRTGANTWDAGTKITASDPEAGAYFGYSVSISGDYAVVGAYLGGNTNAGAAYIFHRTGANTWDAGAKLTASDLEAYAYFGNSVSISGDYAVVGAYAKDEGGSANAGAAYLFHRTGPNTWDAGTKLTASDLEANAWFGRSVSISGDYAVAGAPAKDEGGSADAGAAYIFHRAGPNTWDAGTKLTASDPEAGAWFGISVSISGDHAIVGACNKDEGGNADAGAAYIY